MKDFILAKIKINVLKILQKDKMAILNIVKYMDQIIIII